MSIEYFIFSAPLFAVRVSLLIRSRRFDFACSFKSRGLLPGTVCDVGYMSTIICLFLKNNLVYLRLRIVSAEIYVAGLVFRRFYRRKQLLN